MRSQPYTSFLCIAALSFLLTVNFRANAQNNEDSLAVDSAFLAVFDEYTFLRDTLELAEPASFTMFQRYQPLYQAFPYLRIGNPGHAMYSPVLSFLTNPSTLTSSVMNSYLPYMDQRENMSYYRNRPPFTVLSYMSGAKKEESIDVIHARNFGKNLNMSLHLNRNASDGFYNQLKTRSAHFNLNINYSTSNHRYTLLTHYYVNRKELEENGGFEDFGSVENPETVGSSRLSNASNDVKDEGFLLSQTIGIGNNADKKDLLIKPIFRLGYDLQLVKGSRKYEDLGGSEGLNTIYNFYDNIYYDSTLTRDTIRYEKISNQFNVFFYPGRERIKFFYRNDLINYDQSYFLDTLYYDHTVGSDFSIYLFNKIYRSDIRVSYVLEGFRKGDLNALIDFHKKKKDTSNKPALLTTLYYNLFNPQYKQLLYRSNNFIWTNDFSKTQRLGLKIGAKWKGYSFLADAGVMTNYIYNDYNALPDQFDERITFISVGLSKILNWKNFFLDNQLIYQNTSNEILPVPSFMVNESAYYQNYMFNHKILFRLGFDAYYFTGYNGMAYMPATGEFYLQNQSIIGNYPFIDVYLTFKLKQAFFFLKMEHVNEGMTGNNFYNIPDYPVPPRTFKWGLKWTMFD